jgi:hypothetical protein
MKTFEDTGHVDQPETGRRMHVRRPYQRRQNVAFGAWKEVPTSDAFVGVEFVDLSESGCSFRIDSIATTKDVVIELGVPPKVMYVRATIKYMTPETGGEEFTCLVGCQFTGRLA